jgi:ribosomal protein L7/L12
MDISAHPYLLAALAFCIGFELARNIYSKSRATAPVRLPESISDAEIEAAVHRGRYIEAIKLYRQRHNCGLKDAKQTIDTIAKRSPVQR